MDFIKVELFNSFKIESSQIAVLLKGAIHVVCTFLTSHLWAVSTTA